MKTMRELIRCAVRELAIRKKVYPRWVASGRMTQADCDHEIACMEAIAKNLRAQEQGELL